MSKHITQDQLNHALDAGHRTFSRFKTLQFEKIFPAIDFDTILSRPNAKLTLQSLPAQVLYHALLKKGPQDCLDLLPLVSKEQFVRILDYDSWHKDRLVPYATFRWLNLYKEISPSEMYKRFRDLDEEYQISLIAPYCRVFTKDDYDTMSEQQQDALYRFPNDALFYAILSDDEFIHKSISGLMDASMAEDMNFSMSLLAHASYALAGEVEQLNLQFRNARLEEDGFVTYAESQLAFLPSDPTVFTNAIAAPETRLIKAGDSNKTYLDRVIQHGRDHIWSKEQHQYIQTAFLYLANTVCSATDVEADDTARLKDLLEHTSSLVSFALDTLNNGDIAQSAHMLARIYPKKLFQLALGLTEDLRAVFMDSLKKLPISQDLLKQLHTSWKQRKYALSLNILDQHFLDILGYEHTQELKALFNRFPLISKTIDHKLSFKPVENFAEFYSLAQKIEKIIHKLQLASFSTAKNETIQSLDQSLLHLLLSTVVKDTPEHKTSDLDMFMKHRADLDEKAFVENLKEFLTQQSSMISLENYVAKNLMKTHMYSPELSDDLLELLKTLYQVKKEGKQALIDFISAKFSKQATDHHITHS